MSCSPIVRGKRQPSLTDELKTIKTKMPTSVTKILNQLARRDLCTRSDVMRSIIVADLRRRGFLPAAILAEPTS